RSSRNDSNFQQRISMFKKPTTNGVTSFMISNDLFFLGENDLIFLFQTADHAINRILEIAHVYSIFPFSGSDQSSFVTNVCDICTCKAGRLFCKFMYVERLRNFDGFQMHFEDRFTTFYIRLINRYLPVETARS